MKQEYVFQIREVQVSDIDMLFSISRQTFVDTFAAQNTEENMRQYLAENLSHNKLLEELTDPESQFYFLETNNRVIGYLKLNRGHAQTEPSAHESIEIERIYVLQEFQGMKAGLFLMEKAIEIAHEQQAAYIWLGVWEENHRAIRFYVKNNFVPFGRHLFILGEDEQWDILMKKVL